MSNEVAGTLPTTYEQRLDRDWGLALSEGSRFFEEKSEVRDTLHRVTRRLSDLEVPYAVAGGMALFRHGFRRFTEDVHILVTREGLKKIHESLEELGHISPITGVRISETLSPASGVQDSPVED